MVAVCSGRQIPSKPYTREIQIRTWTKIERAYQGPSIMTLVILCIHHIMAPQRSDKAANRATDREGENTKEYPKNSVELTLVATSARKI